MSSFPPKRWDVRFTKDMRTLSCTHGPDGPGINMEAFLAVKPASGEEGGFQFALDGPEKITLKFNIQTVLPLVPGNTRRRQSDPAVRPGKIQYIDLKF